MKSNKRLPDKVWRIIYKNSLLVATLFLLTGCGKEQQFKDIEEALDTLETLEDTVQTITVEQSPVPNLGIKKEEFLQMELPELKSLIKNTIPNYLEYFKVPDGYELTDEDWENFRVILSLEVYGNAFLDESEEVAEEVSDPNKIYYDMDAEYIGSLTDKEFVEYLTGLQAYNYPEIEVVDYSQLTSEQIKEVRDTLLAGIEE